MPRPIPARSILPRSGSGAATDVAGELFNMMAGVHLVNVPYRSSYLPDLLSGQVQASFTPILQSLGYIRAGKLRALAVTDATRSKVLPDVPTISEFVPGYRGDRLGRDRRAREERPPDIIDKLNKEIDACSNRSGDQGAVRRSRLRADGDDAAPRFGKFARRRNREMGQGGQIRRHQGASECRVSVRRWEEFVMKLRRRRFLQLAECAAALPGVARIARAQAYPSRPVRLIVTVPAGGSPDIIGRLIAQWLSEKLGQPFVVENKPGASTNIGTELVLKAAPDGGTLLLAMSSNAINPSLYHHLNFNFLQRRRAGGEHRHDSAGHGCQSRVSGRRRFPNSSPMPRPIRARSTWRRAAAARRFTSPARCSG